MSRRVDRLRPARLTLAGSPIRNWRTAFLLGAIVVACLLTPFVNPHGLEMIRIWQRIVGSKVLPEVINEHMPMDPTKPLGLAVIGLGVFYIVLLGGYTAEAPRVTWLIPLVWFVLSFKGIRQGPLFAIMAAVAIADLWPHTHLAPAAGEVRRRHDGDRTLREPSRRVRRGGLLPAFAVLVALVLQVNRGRSSGGRARLGAARPALRAGRHERRRDEYAASVPAGTSGSSTTRTSAGT